MVKNGIAQKPSVVEYGITNALTTEFQFWIVEKSESHPNYVLLTAVICHYTIAVIISDFPGIVHI